MVRHTGWQVDTADVLSHIFYAVGNTDRVLVTWEKGDFSGTLSYPDGDGVFIVATGALPALRPGAPICVEYDGPGDTYRFYTEVVELRDGKIRAQLPYAVERTDRRLTGRVEVPVESGFTFETDEFGEPRTFALRDISVGGVCLQDNGETPFEMGSLLPGLLHLPGQEPMQVCLELLHMRLARGSIVIGTRIAAISIRERGRLARFLVGWTLGSSARA